MESTGQSQERPRTSQRHTHLDVPLLSGKIHILEYDAERQGASPLEEKTASSIDTLLTICNHLTNRVESNSTTGVSPSSRRVVLMDLEPRSASHDNLKSTLKSLASALQAFNIPDYMLTWLTAWIIDQLLGVVSEREDERMAISRSEREVDCNILGLFDFIWASSCAHIEQDADYHYIGSGCCTWREYQHSPYTHNTAAAVLETPDSTIILFRARCASWHVEVEPISQILSRKIMARSATIQSGELLRTSLWDHLCQEIIHDERRTIHQLEASLLHINQEVGDEVRLREGAKQWQKLLGQWRVHFHTRRFLKNRYMQLLDVAFPSKSAIEDQPKRILREAHDEFEAEVKHVRELLESTFNAIMQTLSIIESQKAICEAEYVTRLTQLAFFFIPLSYVAGVCGMNIAEFGDGSLKAWIWAVTSIGVLATTYLLFYHTDILEHVVSPLRARITRRRNRRTSANTKNEATTA